MRNSEELGCVGLRHMVKVCEKYLARSVESLAINDIKH